ncbi:MAG: ribonuclease HI [Chloracidobacterium sp.]|nr:ribonuclease HI [Chloracidobacterium sp.]
MSKNRKQYYAVRNGRQPGIYRTWEECKAQVDGYTNAQFKGFTSLEEAEAYMGYVKTNKPEAGKPSSARPFKTPRPPGASNNSGHGHGDDEARALKMLETRDGLKHVVIYTDGACLGNPGPGGYGVVLLHGKERKEFSRGYRLTTNNRMEMLACIVGLQALKGACAVTLYSDSQYVINSMTKGWALRWRKNNWRRNGEDVPNADLWAKLIDLCDKHKVRFNWVRGHAGNKENERCDQLARQASLSFEMAIDSVYENKI